MRIAVQLDAATTDAVRGRLVPTGPSPRGDGPTAVEQVVARVGAVVHPVHPGVPDRLLTSYFFIEVPDTAAAVDLLDELQRTPGVDAAYVEPSAEPPTP